MRGCASASGREQEGPGGTVGGRRGTVTPQGGRRAVGTPRAWIVVASSRPQQNLADLRLSRVTGAGDAVVAEERQGHENKDRGEGDAGDGDHALPAGQPAGVSTIQHVNRRVVHCQQSINQSINQLIY